MDPDHLDYTAAFLIGLMGSTHCIGMCGGYSASLGLSVNHSHTSLLSALFNIGRISCYTLAGLLVGLLGAFAENLFGEITGALNLLRVAAGFLLIAMGLYISRLWSGLAHIEKAGQRVWALVAPITRRLMPVETPLQALQLGLLWGLLPCGLIYSALTWSALAGDPITSAGLMLFFGLGTFPAMFSLTLFASQVKRLLQQQVTRYVMATLLVIFGLWTILGNIGMEGMDHSHHAGHGTHQEHNTTAKGHADHHSVEPTTEIKSKPAPEKNNTKTHEHHHH